MNRSIKGPLAGLLLGAGCLFADNPVPVDAVVPDRLVAGEVTAESVRTDESGGAARFQIYIQAPVESIWNILSSCEQAFVFVKGIRHCEVLENDGIDALTRQVVKTSWLVPAQDFTFRTHREPYSRVDFVRTAGSPKEMEGAWEFQSLANGVVVTHELRIRTDFPVPRFLIRGVMKNNMPDMLKCIRALSGGSLSEAQAVTDRGSCPGVSD